MSSRNVFMAALAAALLVTGSAYAETFKVDPTHTSVTFRVRHLFTHVEGRFDKFDGEIMFDPSDPTSTSVKGTIDVASINTNLEKRDNHLRGSDFFHVEEHPTITFESTKVSDVGEEGKTGKLHGNLTIRGITKEVVLDAEFHGRGADPWGNVKAGFSGRTEFDRKDFGLKWNETLETGGVLVGENIEIKIDVEGNLVEAETGNDEDTDGAEKAEDSDSE